MYKFKIKHYDGGRVIFISEDGEEISWPMSKLPEGKREGDILFFKILDNNDKQIQAKDILNELLDIN